MPWKIEKQGQKHCVIKESDGSVVHCHDTREEAMAQMRALYANEGKSITFLGIEEAEEKLPMESTDTLVYYGGAVKALGDGKVGGYLVEFSDPATKAGSPDLDKEFFGKDTDYDLEVGKKATVYFDHGRDPVLKRRKFGKAPMKMDDVGVWIEHQLNRADKYENALYQLAEMGKLGWSSGSAPHLVEKKSVGGFTKIISWPLGDDASLTPEPASYTKTNKAVALKSIKSPTFEEFLTEVEGNIPNITTKALEAVVAPAFGDDLETHSLKVETAVEESLAHMAKSNIGLETFISRLASKQEFRAMKDGRALSKRRVDKMRELADSIRKMAGYANDHAGRLEDMIKEAETTQTNRDALQQAAELQYTTFQQLKEGHGHA